MGRNSSDSPRELSPEFMSSMYPERPIRPLPKRRLRERLSPDAAKTISYPPTLPTTTPLFYYPYNTRVEEDARGGPYPLDGQRQEEVERNYISRRNGEDIDSDEEYHELPYRGRFTRHLSDTSGRSYRFVQKPESAKYPKPEPPPSTASSADGYESFENTNNKKKRKIPTPGDVGLNGIHLSNDLASLGISAAGDEPLAQEDFVSGSPKYYGNGGSAMASLGISGPGRGRYGRTRSGRSPLRTLSEASNNWANSRPTKQQPPQWSPNTPTDMISTAIAKAEKQPTTPPRGQENISLLQRQAIKKTSPASTQFTFTCDSQVPGTIAWPGPDSAKTNVYQSSTARNMATQATQTSPKTHAPAGQPRQNRPASQYASETPKHNGKQAAPVKKPRRRAAKEYMIAARQRREQQEYQNYHHPPTSGGEWICEFCEYERIFGSPPEALIRQYEIKDRRIRKQEAERRRLLEKAKLKGRKGKKGNKLAAKNVPPPHDRQPHHQQAQHPASANQSQGTQSEEYYEDEYDDEYPRVEPTPSPTIPPVPRRQDIDPIYAKKLPAAQDAIVSPQKLTT